MKPRKPKKIKKRSLASILANPPSHRVLLDSIAKLGKKRPAHVA